MISTAIFYPNQENELLSFLNKRTYSQIILLADANTNGFCIPVLTNILPNFPITSRIVIPKGEENKTLQVCSLIWNELDNLYADRSSLLVNVGGGMLSDIGGFAASVYKRGIDFINVPTTLLSMVDACYGGKTAIDFNGNKNVLGTFQHPIAIYINPTFLRTLSERILVSGIAETIKHALLSSEDWFQKIAKSNLQELISIDCIQQSLATKIEIVQDDEKDLGKRQSLNLGHTIGHAIESYSLQTTTPLLHGEAIMLGLIHELNLSEQLFQFPKWVRVMVIQLKDTFFPSLKFPYSYSSIAPFLLQDKKNKNGIRMSLLKQIGECVIQVPVSTQQIQDAFL